MLICAPAALGRVRSEACGPKPNRAYGQNPGQSLLGIGENDWPVQRERLAGGNEMRKSRRYSLLNQTESSNPVRSHVPGTNGTCEEADWWW